MPSCPPNSNSAQNAVTEASEPWIQSVLRVLDEEQTLTDQEREYVRHILLHVHASASSPFEDSPESQGAHDPRCVSANAWE